MARPAEPEMARNGARNGANVIFTKEISIKIQGNPGNREGTHIKEVAGPFQVGTPLLFTDSLLYSPAARRRGVPSAAPRRGAGYIGDAVGPAHNAVRRSLAYSPLAVVSRR